MLVVADSSPLITLAATGDLEIVPRLFEDVFVPPEVVAELRDDRHDDAINLLAGSPPEWLHVRPATRPTAIPPLGAGEAAAICLASELHADAILIDDLRGRKIAVERGLWTMGTIGVLELAASRGMLELAAAFSRLRETRFWVSQDLLDERLRVFKRRFDR
jgi:predicted nucleic acid-binding protein